jgi:hypothetical protein
MRTVALIVLGAAIWAGAGFWLSGSGFAEAWLYRIGLTGAAVIPLLFAGIYTWIGMYGRVAAAWWRDEIGTALVIASLTLIPIAGPLAYVFWARGGILTATWLAWLEVSGPCVSALAWLRLCLMWVRISGRKDAE